MGLKLSLNQMRALGLGESRGGRRIRDGRNEVERQHGSRRQVGCALLCEKLKVTEGGRVVNRKAKSRNAKSQPCEIFHLLR
jgi:hypothetical protein